MVAKAIPNCKFIKFTLLFSFKYQLHLELVHIYIYFVKFIHIKKVNQCRHYYEYLASVRVDLNLDIRGLSHVSGGLIQVDRAHDDNVDEGLEIVENHVYLNEVVDLNCFHIIYQPHIYQILLIRLF